MKHVLAVAAALMLAAVSPTAGAVDRPSEKTITVCRPEYTPDGQRVSWQASYLYRVTTDGDGAVAEVKALHKPKEHELVREEGLVKCVRAWRLDAEAKYTVDFFLGTSALQNYIWIHKFRGETIRLILR